MEKSEKARRRYPETQYGCQNEKERYEWSENVL